MKKTILPAKRRRFWPLALFLLPLLFFQACEEEEVYPSDPAERILGKWEIIEVGNWPNMQPYPAAGYVEYAPDSIRRFFDYEEGRFTGQSTYWFEDSLLVVGIRRPDGYLLRLKEKVQFSKEKMKLEIMGATSIFSTSIYKKIE